MIGFKSGKKSSGKKEGKIPAQVRRKTHRAYVNGTILTGRIDEDGKMQAFEDRVLLTKGDRIIGIGDRNTDLWNYDIVDLSGGYIMPGMINLHVHMPSTGKPHKKQADPEKTVKTLGASPAGREIIRRVVYAAAKTELMSGVTTLRAVGGALNSDSQVRDRIKKGAMGPRMIVCNTGISVPGGHMAGSVAYRAHTPDEAARLAERIASQDADWIKLMITGGILDADESGKPGALKMPPVFVRRACDRAHSMGLRVCAHCEGTEGVRVALENGVDTVEHGAVPDDDLIALFRGSGAALVTTLSPGIPFVYFDRSVSRATPVQQEMGRTVLRGMIENSKACLRAGVPVGLGTDTGCPWVTHYDMWRELEYFVRFCEVSRDFALHTATQVNAEILGLGDEIGTLEPGKCADMIVSARDPRTDAEALRNLKMVVSRGRIIQDPKVKKFRLVEKELDRILHSGAGRKS